MPVNVVGNYIVRVELYLVRWFWKKIDYRLEGHPRKLGANGLPSPEWA